MVRESLDLLGKIWTWILKSTGFVYMGTVTSVTDANNFVCSDLKGFGNDRFVGWRIRCDWDSGGANAAPQGEYALSTDYVSATGGFVHNAYTANLAAGDIVQLIHPLLYEILTIRGGSTTLQHLKDWQDNNLDLRRTVIPVTCDGGDNVEYTREENRPWRFEVASIDFTGANFGAGEDTIVTINVKTEDGGGWHKRWSSPPAGAGSFLNAALPDPVVVEIPSPDYGAHVNLPILNVYGVEIKIKQNAVGGGWNDLVLEVFESI